MKVGHTLFFESPEKPRNATVYRDTTAQIEGAVLLTVAVVSGLGNLLVLAAMTTCSRFRATTTAFLSHHCILDSLKSLFCVPFACALLLDMDIPYCNALGALYIFLMTLTAYNLLALHINEEYQLTNQRGYVPGRRRRCQDDLKKKNDSFWCVSFGIVMIWFTTVLLHLGVAFLPSSAEFSYDIGNCVFNYGTPKNYVIHVLWAILVTAALMIAIVCFTSFFCKLRAHMRRKKGGPRHLRISVSQEINPPTLTSRRTKARKNKISTHAMVRQETEETKELHYEFGEAMDQTTVQQMQLYLRRAVVMLLMVISFLLFWYPLFILTIMDVSYTRPPQIYRICMILAWTHPVTTPIFCTILYFDVTHTSSRMKRSSYPPTVPVQTPTSFPSTSYQNEPALPQLPHDYSLPRETSFSYYGSSDFIEQEPDPEEYCDCQRMTDDAWHEMEYQTVSPDLHNSLNGEEQEQGMHHLTACEEPEDLYHVM